MKDEKRCLCAGELNPCEDNNGANLEIKTPGCTCAMMLNRRAGAPPL